MVNTKSVFGKNNVRIWQILSPYLVNARPHWAFVRSVFGEITSTFRQIKRHYVVRTYQIL